MTLSKLNLLHIDLETFSSIPISSGVRKYTSSNDFHIQLFGVKKSWGEFYSVEIEKGEKIPKGMLELLASPTVTKVAHNAEFEIECLKVAGIPVKGKWICTMLMAKVLGLPGNLDKLGEVLKLKHQKKKGGTSLVNWFSKPTKTGLIHTPGKYPEKWEKYKEYNRYDVLTEEEAFEVLKAMGGLKLVEWDLWELDKKINSRGIMIDIPMVDRICEMNDREIEAKLERAKEITGLSNPNSISKLKKWLAENEPEIIKDMFPDGKISLTTETLQRLLTKELNRGVREVLKIRKAVSSTSLAKYYSMLASEIEGRIYNVLRFCNCRTRRWTGSKEQIQNFPRTYLSDDIIIRYKELIMDGVNPEIIEDGALKQLLRPAIIAPEGKVLSVCDWSAIEARIIAWLAGEDWVNTVFAGNGKIYEAQASKMFRTPMDKITKELRTKGKRATLYLGYGGALGALKSSGDWEGSDEEALEIVRKYRSANKKIVQFWKKLEKATITVLTTNRQVCVNNKIVIGHNKKNGLLVISLPSHNNICYQNARVVDNKILYDGWDSQKRKWGAISLFGGKIAENITQAVARDILAHSLIKFEENQMHTIFHVHDEIVCEGDPCLSQMIEIMEKSPSWAEGLILRAEGYESKFYKKE
jgi:DNA polymerase